MNHLFKLNLQLFASDEAGAGGPNANPAEDAHIEEGGDEAKPKEPTEKTFTQSEVDEIVKKRLEREKARQEAEKAEAQRLAAMTEQDRQQELMKQKDKLIEEKEATIRMMELKEDTIKVLDDEGIDLKFMSFLMAENAETTKHNIDTFKAVFNACVQEEVEKRIAGTTPKQKETPLEKKEERDMTDVLRSKRVI